ncbi:MAG TPA: hypothetical protein VJU15_03990 [Gemmatimonadales bacterium]|nr:hypothetical protein [Gemmatimonadales bacterium]
MRMLLALAFLALFRPLALSAQNQKDLRSREQKRTGLVRESLAGQNVPVMPITMITRDTSVTDSLFHQSRPVLMGWADSVLAEALILAAPEISWLYGAELNRVARRGAGMLPEPAKMGQAILRSEKMKTVPDPTRSNFRMLAALAGGRYIFVPASVAFGHDSTGALMATLAAALTDTRSGAVLWHTLAIGRGENPREALFKTVEYFLPDQSTPP